MHLCVDFHDGPSKEYLIFFLFELKYSNLQLKFLSVYYAEVTSKEVLAQTFLAVLSLESGNTRATVAPSGVCTTSTVLTWTFLTFIDILKTTTTITTTTKTTRNKRQKQSIDHKADNNFGSREDGESENSNYKY